MSWFDDDKDKQLAEALEAVEILKQNISVLEETVARLNTEIEHWKTSTADLDRMLDHQTKRHKQLRTLIKDALNDDRFYGQTT